MSNYLNKIIYLTDDQYDTLKNTNSITVNNVTYQFDPDTLYITDTNLITQSPSADGTATQFITDITQDKYGKISASKANLDTSGNWNGIANKATNDQDGNLISSTYYKLDGSNTGTKLQISTQSAAYTNGIQFMNDITKKGSIGADANGTVGIYGTKITLRPQLDVFTVGVEVTTTAMYPTASMTLGTISNKWSTVYATTFDGNATTATSSKILANYYTNRPTNANIAHVNNGGVVHFKATSTMTSNKPMDDGSILHFYWDNDNAWNSQLYIPDSSNNSMQWRASSKANTWDSWRTLLDANNYTSYAVAKTAGVTAVTWDATNKKLTRTIDGTAADVMTAAQMSTALELGTIASKAITDYLPVKYSNLDYSSTATTMGIYSIDNNQTHPVTGKSEYGGAIQFGDISTSNNYYAAQLLISSQSGKTSPVHAYIRRMTSDPDWSNWATLLDNNNYTDYTVTKTGTGATGTWGISISGKAGSVDWANTGHPATFPPTIGTTATTAMAGDTDITIVAIAVNDTSSTDTFPVTYAATNTSTTTAKNDTLKKSTGKLYFQPSTGTLTATKFSGPLTGDVTGDVSGSSSSCTGNSATASKLTDLTSSDQATNNNTWRRVWISYQNNTNGRPAYKDTIAFQTSTNTLRSGKYLVDESVILEYNSTDESLDFTFI